MSTTATLGTVALIVAAGRGVRLGGRVPKQYRTLAGMPMLRRTVGAFARHPAVDAVRVLIHPDDRPLYDEAVAGLELMRPVEGGETRQESCRLGLESLADDRPERVMIHDASRPLVDRRTIDRVLAALDRAPAAVPALPVADTLKRASEDGIVQGTVDRSGLWRAQTPQAFHYTAILNAHRAAAGQGLTDDAAVAEAAKLEVALVPGSEDNLKITVEEDFSRAERLLGAGDLRVGTGFDTHRFGEGDHVMLCGVPVPHERGLAGHSDADVGLHALADAILGAIGAGDIGLHFPATEEEWRDRASDHFLREASALVGRAGGRIRNVDITLICERPRIAAHREAMRDRVAAILGLERDRVNVKASTTEGLGFTGRGEGIAAQATAT
ncbi:MAG: bifunctional 2-C-methyl-D-erythritol 4-phosphate cytidylyltransferase/2-C-methyl-D-erythritol 2,4-cyclodiphosphate synthase, partial [Alphaproteobacteria bacterium]